MKFDIIEREFSPEELVDFDEKREKFIVDVPEAKLREMYEVTMLCDLIGLRAEYKESPEHQKEALDKIKRNTQNPNFDQVLKYIELIRTEKSLKHLEKLAGFITTLDLPRLKGASLTQIEKWTPDVFDIRYCQKPEEWFSYIFNYYKLK